MADTSLRIPSALWAELLRQLHLRTRGRHESGAFLLGPTPSPHRAVTHVIYYDDVDVNAYRTGVVVLHADAFTRLWARCSSLGLEVVADIHVHEFGSQQSFADRDHPMIAQKGHIALIVPSFAAPPVRLETIGMHEYLGNHRWKGLSGRTIQRYLHIAGN